MTGKATESIDVSDCVDLPGSIKIAVDIYTPKVEAAAILFCFPGGGCNRHYFDLSVSDDTSYSFAQSMCDKGYLVVTVDHLGVGRSTKPENGFEVTLDRLVAANASVVQQLRARLAGNIPCVGVGHSMGAMLTILLQDARPVFSALLLLGFSNVGMPDYLCDLGRRLALTPEIAKLESRALAREQFVKGYFNLPQPLSRAAISHSVTAEAYRVLGSTREALISIPAAFALIPDCVLAETKRTDVPVFVAVGDRDICGPSDNIPSQFSSEATLTLLTLEETGHMHFVYKSRGVLMAEVGTWLSTL